MLLFYSTCAMSKYCSHQIKSHHNGEIISNQGSLQDIRADTCAEDRIYMESYSKLHFVATIIKSHFHSNDAALCGGGKYFHTVDALEISHTIFSHNKAATRHGGGIYLLVRT